MPFRSEKQRRYLWATNPDMARRWAHEYPQKKKLPMYAADEKTDKTEKPAETKKSASILSELNKTPVSVNTGTKCKINNIGANSTTPDKTAGDRLIKVNLPECEGPTYAGQNDCGDEINFDIANKQQEDQYVEEKNPENAADSILQKLSSVLSPVLRQKIEEALARREERPAREVPKNPGFRRYFAAVSQIPPPVGHPANPVDPAQNLASAQPQNPNRLAPVGGGSNPRHNVINSFGAISATGNLNGNAAFGAKNSPDSSKIAAEKLAMRMRAPMCPCGCGEKVYRCRCPQSCQCRKPGQPCGKYQKKAAVNWQKAARCWAGYEPVPGKKPYSEDSCRPVGSAKKKQKKQENKNESEKKASILSLIGLAGRRAAPAAAKAVAKAVPRSVLSVEKAHPSVLTALAAARKVRVPASRMAEQAKYLFDGSGIQPRPPALRLRMPGSGGLMRRFGDTLDEQLSLTAATDRFSQVMKRLGRANLAVSSSGGQNTTWDNLFGAAKQMPSWAQLKGIAKVTKQAGSPAWQRSEGKNEEGGLNAKGRASYNKATGGNLKAPVTEKNPTGKRKSRRASFCARMGGMKKKLTGKDTASDPDSRINKALRKWNC